MCVCVCIGSVTSRDFEIDMPTTMSKNAQPMDVEVLAKEIEAMEAFLQKRARILSSNKKPDEEMLLAQFTNVKARLEAMRASGPHDALKLMNLLLNGPWTKEHKNELVKCIKLDLVSEVPGKPHVRRPMQTCDSIERYLTAKDWKNMTDSKTMLLTNMMTIAGRMSLLGIQCPSEPLCMRGTALALQQSGMEPKSLSQEQVSDYFAHFKKMLKGYARQKPWTFDYVTKYPALPKDLPDEIYQHAYVNDDYPANTGMDDLLELVEAFKMRARDKKIEETNSQQETLKKAFCYDILLNSLPAESTIQNLVALQNKSGTSANAFKTPEKTRSVSDVSDSLVQTDKGIGDGLECSSNHSLCGFECGSEKGNDNQAQPQAPRTGENNRPLRRRIRGKQPPNSGNNLPMPQKVTSPTALAKIEENMKGLLPERKGKKAQDILAGRCTGEK